MPSNAKMSKASKPEPTNEMPSNNPKAGPTSEMPEKRQSSMQHVGNHAVFDIDDNGLFS